MDLTYWHYQYKYTYYKLLIYKLKWNEIWSGFSRNTRFIYCCSVCFGSAFAAWLLYRLVQNENLSEDDDFDDRVVKSKRRRKGIPPGLFNDGNTCFLNCVLQALASCSSFYNWTSSVLSNQNKDGTLFPAVHKLIKVLRNVSGNEDVYSTSDVVASFRAHGWIISHEQQDAYEFLQALTSTMEEELEKIINLENTVPSNTLLDVKLNPRFSSSICNRVGKQLPLLFGSKEFISPLKGSYASTLTCLSCGNKLPVKFESFDSLILNLANISPFGATLRSCLEKWVEPELLHQVECENCYSKHKNKYSTFKKQVSLAKLPSCLCIQLQRTTYSSVGVPQKNQMYVQFPELLDVRSYTYGSVLGKNNNNCTTRSNTVVDCPLRGGSDGSVAVDVIAGRRSSHHNTLYRLASVIVHYGVADAGHFITCRKLTTSKTDSHATNEKWFQISDSNVATVEKETVLRSTAYLLFYEKLQ